MDTLKSGSYTDSHDSLEKGTPNIQGPCTASSPPAVWSRPHRSFTKRPWIALGAVVLILLGVSYGRHTFYGRPPHVWRWDDDKGEHPPPPDQDVDHCVGSTNWTIYHDQPTWAPDYPHGAESTFSLPLDSDVLYLVSGSMFQHGLVNIEQSTQVADTVDVRVRVAYSNDKALEHAFVCQLERADKEYGVGIFTPLKAPHPSYHGHAHGLEFDVTLTLPAGKGGPLTVKKLETRLPVYDQNVADLGESVVFDQISLASISGKLSIQSVTSEVGHFSSVNGAIDGHFNARSSLDLHIANGHIRPTVNLSNRECADPSSLTIHAMNGEIDAEVALTSDVLTGGEFEVDVQSRRGGIGLKFTDSPVDSVLRCYAKTIVGGIQVELDRAYEGTFLLANVIGGKLVSQHDVEDPAGRGRRRVVSVHETHGRVEGDLIWQEGDGNVWEDGGGHVVLKGVLSSVKLVV